MLNDGLGWIQDVVARPSGKFNVWPIPPTVCAHDFNCWVKLCKMRYTVCACVGTWNESYPRAYEWFLSHMWMSHITRVNESCLPYEWALWEMEQWCMLHIDVCYILNLWLSHARIKSEGGWETCKYWKRKKQSKKENFFFQNVQKWGWHHIWHLCSASNAPYYPNAQFYYWCCNWNWMCSNIFHRISHDSRGWAQGLSAENCPCLRATKRCVESQS